MFLRVKELFLLLKSAPELDILLLEGKQLLILLQKL
jgi:hypothetical protein